MDSSSSSPVVRKRARQGENGDVATATATAIAASAAKKPREFTETSDQTNEALFAAAETKRRNEADTQVEDQNNTKLTAQEKNMAVATTAEREQPSASQQEKRDRRQTSTTTTETSKVVAPTSDASAFSSGQEPPEDEEEEEEGSLFVNENSSPATGSPPSSQTPPPELVPGASFAQQLQTLSFAEAQRLIANELETLTHQVAQLTKQNTELQRRQLLASMPPRMAVASSPRVTLPQGGWKQFLAFSPEHGTIFSSHSETAAQIFVASRVAGPGRRRQAVDNSLRRFDCAALNATGFALAHTGIDVEHLGFGRLEFHYFSSVSIAANSWWGRRLECPLRGVALTKTLVVVAAGRDTVQLFTLSGRCRGNKRLAGVCVALAAEGGTERWMAATKLLPNGGMYRVDVMESVETLWSCDFHSEGDCLTWAGFTPLGVPIICDSNCTVMAFFPVGTGRAAVQLARLQSEGLEKLWICCAGDDKIELCNVDCGNDVCETPKTLSVAYRLAQALPDGVTAVPLEAVSEVVGKDPGFSGSTDTGDWPWQEFDGLCARLQLWRMHLDWELQRERPQSDKARKMDQALKTNKLATDRLLLRVFVRCAQECRNETAVDAAKDLSLAKSFALLQQQAAREGWRVLVELLDDLASLRENGGGPKAAAIAVQPAPPPTATPSLVTELKAATTKVSRVQKL